MFIESAIERVGVQAARDNKTVPVRGDIHRMSHRGWSLIADRTQEPDKRLVRGVRAIDSRRETRRAPNIRRFSSLLYQSLR